MLAALWRKPIVEANAWECQSINESWVKSLESWMLRGFESRVSVQLVFRPASFWRPWRGIPWGPQWSESGSWNASAGCKRRSSSGCMRSTGFRDGGSASASGGAVWVLKFSDLTHGIFLSFLWILDEDWTSPTPVHHCRLGCCANRKESGRDLNPRLSDIRMRSRLRAWEPSSAFMLTTHNSCRLLTHVNSLVIYSSGRTTLTVLLLTCYQSLDWLLTHYLLFTIDSLTIGYYWLLNCYCCWCYWC